MNVLRVLPAAAAAASTRISSAFENFAVQGSVYRIEALYT
jgi:hypothetical protein